MNNVPGNVHVKAAFLKPCDLAEFPRMASPARRVDLEDSFGGRMIFVATDG